jgi:hypothetical protein
MARYTAVDRSPRFLPISLEAQLMVGNFEHALDVLVYEELELSAFERWYCNDETGAPAYDPGVMLKIVLLAYSKGVVSSRAIRACNEKKTRHAVLRALREPRTLCIMKWLRPRALHACRRNLNPRRNQLFIQSRYTAFRVPDQGALIFDMLSQ